MLSVTYLSSASIPFTARHLVDLLENSRSFDSKNGVTGVLLHADGNFIQTLEGPADVVEATLARISAEARHHGVLEVWRAEIDERQFPEWTMGFRELDAAAAESVPGFNAYLQSRGAAIAGDEFTPEVFFRIFRDGLP